jgi:hypothetical protein
MTGGLILGPLQLTDDQLDAIMRAAAPLARDAREPFLEAVAARLRDREIGDGTVYLAIREVQRRHFDPPLVKVEPHGHRGRP